MLQQKPCSRNVEIPGGEGVIKDPLGTEIPKGGGMQTKNLPWEGCGYFLEPHNRIIDYCKPTQEVLQIDIKQSSIFLARYTVNSWYNKIEMIPNESRHAEKDCSTNRGRKC